jgi:hypothetical protein
MTNLEQLRNPVLVLDFQSLEPVDPFATPEVRNAFEAVRDRAEQEKRERNQPYADIVVAHHHAEMIGRRVLNQEVLDSL